MKGEWIYNSIMQGLESTRFQFYDVLTHGVWIHTKWKIAEYTFYHGGKVRLTDWEGCRFIITKKVNAGYFKTIPPYLQ